MLYSVCFDILENSFANSVILFCLGKLTTPFGSQKLFFDLIWRRLHPELHIDEDGEEGDDGEGADDPHEELTAKAPQRKLIRLSREGGPTTREATQAQDSITTAPHSPVQSPPIIHRGKNMKSHQIVCNKDQWDEDDVDDARPKRDICMIPKKRFLYCQSNDGMQRQECRLGGLTPPPLQHQPSPPSPQQQVTKSYSESDVSIAMILANGFGRDNNDKKESPEGPSIAEV